MSFIRNFVLSTMYNRFSQSPAIQDFSIGWRCLNHGTHLLRDTDPSQAPSLIRKVGRKAAGVAFLAIGLAEMYYGSRLLRRALLRASMYYGGRALLRASRDALKAAFLRQNPYDLSSAFSTFKEPQELPTEVLYLQADPAADYNGAFEDDTLPKDLRAIKKLTHAIIQNPLQICGAIQRASQRGPVQDLVIAAHGKIHAMGLSPTSQFHVFDELPANCFDGLSSTARIFLESCSTGKNSLWSPSMAEWLSWLSGKEVIAPSDPDNNAKCAINPIDGRLDIRILNEDSDELIDLTKHFNLSASWKEKSLFFIKLMVSGVLGAMTTWQMMRIEATVLQASGVATQWIVDKSAAPIKRLAERIGLYNLYTAEGLYTVTKGTGQILNFVGKTVNQGIDRVIQSVNSLESWVCRKSVTAVTNLAKNLFSKLRRN